MFEFLWFSLKCVERDKYIKGALEPMKLCKKGGLFMTEWGTSQDSGNGATDFTEATRWSDWCGEESIGMCNWALNDKEESSNAVQPGAGFSSPTPPPELELKHLSPSGTHVLEKLIKKFNLEHYGKDGKVGSYDLKCNAEGGRLEADDDEKEK
eukprot:g14556.t1